ncbi:MAG: hypothetical protein K6D02_02615 [Lachnospiraceae bacterium]|nr:hypothetical protein [Lachnospiraceae bacterium]
MITLERTSVVNFENAIRGARNPMNSWNRMDSSFDEKGNFVFGPNDLDLAKRLCKAGNDHRKFIRQIFISVDITAPIYWWKEYDTYKVGTVANSTSTMHKIHSKPFEMDDFSHDHLTEEGEALLKKIVDELEVIRLKYVETKDKALWYSMIQLLPEGYNQMRTCTFSYENAVAMFGARCNHKLKEWHTFCKWVTELPYMTEFFPDMEGYEP